jgi:hypothetical protein
MTTPVEFVTVTALDVPSLTLMWQGPRFATRMIESLAGVPGRRTAVEANPKDVPWAASTANDAS